MTVRALENITNDWTFGTGTNAYKQKNLAVAQAIQCALNSFLGDCFFDVNAGVNWFNLLGTKNQEALNLAISAAILNVQGVTAIRQILVTLNPKTRGFTLQYKVQTVYSVLTGNFEFSLPQ